MLSDFSYDRLCMTLWTDYSLAPLSIRTLQARILEWVAMPSSRGVFPTQVSNCIFYLSCIVRQVLYH